MCKMSNNHDYIKQIIFWNDIMNTYVNSIVLFWLQNIPHGVVHKFQIQSLYHQKTITHYIPCRKLNILPLVLCIHEGMIFFWWNHFLPYFYNLYKAEFRKTKHNLTTTWRKLQNTLPYYSWCITYFLSIFSNTPIKLVQNWIIWDFIF